MGKLIFIPLIMAVVFTSCRQQQMQGNKGQGSVEYDITYRNNELDIPQHLLPQKMTMTFTKRYSKNIIEGYAGIISIRNINDLKKDTVTTLFKLFNHKVYYTSRPRETPCCFEILEKPKITFTGDTLHIAGLLCHKVLINNESDNSSREVFYTKEIETHSVNKNTSFEDIPGILMDFEMTLGKLTMHFKATNVEYKDIDNKEFTLPTGYKKISRGEMVKIINQLLE
jgi:GLPGLI family protein